jgi:hypothetical protein
LQKKIKIIWFVMVPSESLMGPQSILQQFESISTEEDKLERKLVPIGGTK